MEIFSGKYCHTENKILDFHFEPVCSKQSCPSYNDGSNQDEAKTQHNELTKKQSKYFHAEIWKVSLENFTTWKVKSSTFSLNLFAPIRPSYNDESNQDEGETSITD